MTREVHGEGAAFPAELFDDAFRRLDGAVAEAGGSGDDENLLGLGRGGHEGGAGGEDENREEARGQKRVFHVYCAVELSVPCRLCRRNRDSMSGRGARVKDSLTV